MKAIGLFALDLLESLSIRQGDQDRWEYTLNRLAEHGFNALNMLCFTPSQGDIHWVRSSMSKQWLDRYASQGFAEVDPMLGQVSNKTESLYVRAASLESKDGHPQQAVALNHELMDAGYIHLFSLIVPCPANEAKLVVLSSDRPEAQEVMVENQREMRILATVLALNLGAETPSDHGRVLDIGPMITNIPGLTVREKEVLSLLAEGYRNERIADALGLSEITIRSHLRAAREKLRVPTREAALVRAMQLGLINPRPYRKR